MNFNQQAKGRPERTPNTFKVNLEPEIDVKEILRKIWRRKSLVIGTATSTTLLALVIILQIPPKYFAETMIMIETKKSNAINLEAVVTGLSSESETVFNEIEVLRSRGLISKLVTQLHLEKIPELNPIKREGFFSAITAFVGGGGKSLGVLTEGEKKARERSLVVSHVLSRLRIAPKGVSRVISIGFTSTDPRLAAKITNSLADLYIIEQLEVKFSATQRAAQWLNDRVAGLQQRVKKSERAVESFRARSDLLQGKGVNLVTQNMVELNAELVKAETAFAVAQARLNQVRKIRTTTNDISSIAEVIDSKLIQRLREEQAKVERKAAELSVEYGERHPKLVNVRAEVNDIQKSIENEVRKILKVLERSVGVAKARRDSLKTSLAETKTAVSKANRQQVLLRALEREANADRLLLDTFLAKFKETSEQEDRSVQVADARIISSADIPTSPSSPKKKILLFVALVAGLSFGIAIALFIEYLDHGYRTVEQLERGLNTSVLSHIPLLKRSEGRAEDYLIKNPISEYGEAVRTLHTGLLLSHLDNPPKSVVITSAQPHEGKSTLAISMARLLARGGSKILLVDGDLRKPSIATLLKLKQSPGLVEHLRKEVGFEAVIQIDEPSGTHVITSGETTPNSSDIIGSENMTEMLQKAEGIYDLVIFDSPPVLAVSDARILSTKVNSTIFVVRWAETSRLNAAIGLKQIADVSSHIAGTVLTLIDMRKLPRYQGASSTYYYRQDSDLYFENSD